MLFKHSPIPSTRIPLLLPLPQPLRRYRLMCRYIVERDWCRICRRWRPGQRWRKVSGRHIYYSSPNSLLNPVRRLQHRKVSPQRCPPQQGASFSTCYFRYAVCVGPVISHVDAVAPRIPNQKSPRLGRSSGHQSRFSRWNRSRAGGCGLCVAVIRYSITLFSLVVPFFPLSYQQLELQKKLKPFRR
jgi:hypothetical protein